MRTQYKDGELTISLDDIFRKLQGPERDEFLLMMACEDAVIRAVSEQILQGCTDEGWHGATGSTATTPNTPLDRAVRAVAKGASALAAEEISLLEQKLREVEEELQKKDRVIHELTWGRRA